MVCSTWPRSAGLSTRSGRSSRGPDESGRLCYQARSELILTWWRHGSWAKLQEPSSRGSRRDTESWSSPDPPDPDESGLIVGVGEPDPSLEVDGQVVGDVELASLEAVGQHGDGAVGPVAHHPPGPALAGVEHSVRVEYQPVGHDISGLVSERKTVEERVWGS
jgi:hypothetical protein